MRSQLFTWDSHTAAERLLLVSLVKAQIQEETVVWWPKSATRKIEAVAVEIQSYDPRLKVEVLAGRICITNPRPFSEDSEAGQLCEAYLALDSQRPVKSQKK